MTWQVTKEMPGLIIDSMKFTASTWFSPLPTGYCITKNNFFKSVEQTKSMLRQLRTVKQCAKNQINDFVKYIEKEFN